MHKIAIITGASRGLGFALAQFLAAQSYRLILTARGVRDLEWATGRLPAPGGPHVPIAGNVAEAGHRRQLISAARDLGSLDLLVNNASTLGAAPLPSLANYPLPMLEQAFSTNVIAPLGLVQEALPLLAGSKGMIINISSDAATGGYPGWGGYGATKAALDLISVTLAHELEDNGVAVVSVDPGDLRTEMHQQAFPGEDISDRPKPEVTYPFWAWLLGQAPMSISGRRFQAQAELWEAVP